MDIKVLGPGCKNCVTLDRIVHEVVAEMGIDAAFEKVEDYAAIASYGVMNTPALVVDGKVINGLQGIGGEWGHNFLDESGGSCYCGKSGCVEKV